MDDFISIMKHVAHDVARKVGHGHCVCGTLAHDVAHDVARKVGHVLCVCGTLAHDVASHWHMMWHMTWHARWGTGMGRVDILFACGQSGPHSHLS